MKKEQIYYVLNSICNEDGEVFSNHRDALNHFAQTYYDEYVKYDNRKRSFPGYNLVKDIAEWLRGLPSTVNIHFANYDIAQLGREWGYVKTDEQEEEFVDGWFETIARWLFELCDAAGVIIRQYRSTM